MADTSVAYDVARFEEREERAQLRREQPRVVTQSRPSMWGGMIKFMFMAAIAAVSLGTFLASNAQITEKDDNIFKDIARYFEGLAEKAKDRENERS